MQRGFQKFGRTAFAAATVAVCVIGLSTVAQPAEGAKACPLIYSPVKCDNGKTYTNQCFADRAHATGCYPIGGPTPF